MRKKPICFVLVCFLSLVIFTGCSDEKTEDTHYKPSEYKHNVAINTAERTISDVEREIIYMGAETSADIVIETYNDSLAKLREQIKLLESTKKQLNDDNDLTKSELSDWNTRYKDTVKAVENSINSIEKQRTNFLK